MRNTSTVSVSPIDSSICGTLAGAIRRFNKWTDDKCLVTSIERFAHFSVCPVPFGRRYRFRRDRFSTGRFFFQDGDIELAVQRQREAARYRGGRQTEHMRHISSFRHQFFPLFNPKSMLFIDDDKPQIMHVYFVLDECVRANDEFRATARDELVGVFFLRSGHRAYQ